MGRYMKCLILHLVLSLSRGQGVRSLGKQQYTEMIAKKHCKQGITKDTVIHNSNKSHPL